MFKPLVCAALCFATVSSALAQDASTATAMELVRVMDSEANLDKGLNVLIDQFCKDLETKGRTPGVIAKVRAEAEQWKREEIKMTELQTQLAAAYASEFTEAELKQILAFQNSPVGKKLQAVGPSLAQKKMAASQAYIAPKLRSLDARLQKVSE